MSTDIKAPHPDDQLVPPAYEDDLYESDTPAPPLSPKRRPSESSTERSLYDDEKDTGSVPAAGSSTATAPESPAQAFHFYGEGGLHRNHAICTKNSAGQSVAQYYAESSRLTPNKPDVLLHHGADASGPVIAAAKFRLSRSLHLCLGDLETEHRWEEMRNTQLLQHGQYELRLSRPQGVTTLAWQRTLDAQDGVEGRGKTTLRNYRVVDADSGEVLAVYLHNRLKSWKKHGKLVLYSALDPEVERWIILGTAGLIEKTRRRNARRGAAGGAGGGGAA